MSWVPYYYAVQEEALMDNVLLIVEEDFKAALDVLYPTQAALSPDDPQYMEDFQERAVGQIQRLVFPTLAIGPNRSASTESDAADRLKEGIRLDLYLGVTADSAANSTRKLTRYVGTLDLVLRTALRRNKRRYFRNMSVQAFGLVLEIEKVYGPLRERESIYFRDALFELTFTLNER